MENEQLIAYEENMKGRFYQFYQNNPVSFGISKRDDKLFMHIQYTQKYIFKSPQMVL